MRTEGVEPSCAQPVEPVLTPINPPLSAPLETFHTVSAGGLFYIATKAALFVTLTLLLSTPLTTSDQSAAWR